MIDDSDRTWKKHWSALGDLERGGQADVKRVVRSDGTDDTVCFLKILLHQNDPERRRRMYREVAAYRTLEHPRIPKLVHSNTDKFKDSSFKLNVVTEYIPGMTLSQFIAQNGVLDVESCMVMMIGMLEVVQYCHDQEWIHRDIKPDNIVLRKDSPIDPVLVDFGLSFNRAEEDESKTPSLDELGNRFLRLPELSLGSPMKRDPRSDVTFCAGVLLFGLTGITPSILLDENRRLPHQRPTAMQILGAKFAPRPLQRLLTIFDCAFDIDLACRWQSAAELQSAIGRLNQADQTPEDEIAFLRREVDEYRASSVAMSSEENSNILQHAVDELMRVTVELRSRLGPLLVISQTNFQLDPFKARAATSLSVQRTGQSVHDWVRFTFEIVGSEVVVDAQSDGRAEPIHRTSVHQPEYGPSFKLAAETALLRQLQRELAQHRDRFAG